MCEGCVCLGRGLRAPRHTAGPDGGQRGFPPEVTQGSFGWGCFVCGGAFVLLQAGCEMSGVGWKVPCLPLEGGTRLGLTAAFWHRGTARCALGAPCGTFGSGCWGPRGLGTGGARGSCLQSSAEQQLLLWRVAARALAAFPAPLLGHCFSLLS